ncbi:MAG: DUF4886 domain-containing protein [Clostridia bacterium]|nr:DUF4886 domain-containing protein [Clostridia bacterium]
MNNQNLKSLKILSIGNSFSMDTMEHLANVALSLGYQSVKLGNLYIGGCSLNKHFYNAENDLAAYRYFQNTGDGWRETPEHKISDALKECDWDWISIQHGTKDKSRYTSVESYEKLPALIEYVKGLAWSGAKIAFNMAWVAEPYSHHHEITSYNGDQMLMYQSLLETTQAAVLPAKGLDVLSPTGTAIQNARTTQLVDKLSRDGFHLSYIHGRYIASLTFLKALTGISIDGIKWAPEGVSEGEKQLSVAAANAAIETPFAITPITI